LPWSSEPGIEGDGSCDWKKRVGGLVSGKKNTALRVLSKERDDDGHGEGKR